MTSDKKNGYASTDDANGEIEQMTETNSKDDSAPEQALDTDNFNGLPVDRGWAWAVLAGVAWYLFLFGAVRKNFGLFFVAFQERYHTNASVTSLVATIQNMIISVCSLLVMTIGMHMMSNRTSIIIGAVFKTTATVLAALSTDVGVLFLSIGVLDGVGISLAQNPVISMLGEYFVKSRGLANGLVFCAASFGALIFAPILTISFYEHGYVGTMFVAAGMSLNCLVTGVIMRPISSFSRSRNEIKDMNCSPKDQKEGLLLSDKAAKIQNIDKFPRFHSTEGLSIEKTRLSMDKELLKMNSADPLPLLRTERKRHRTVSQNSEISHIGKLVESLTHSKIALYGSTTAIDVGPTNIQEEVESAFNVTEDNSFHEKSCLLNCRTHLVKVLRIIFDVSLFRNGVFPCILIMGFMFIGGGDCVLITVPPHAKDIGLTSNQRGTLMLLFGCFDLAGRIVLTLIADRGFVKRTTILGTAALVLGISCHLLRFFNGFGAMIAFCIIVGSCSQLYWALHAVIVVDYLTAAKLKSSLGFMTLCHGLSIAVNLPVAGALRDSTGSYVATYHLSGCLLFIGAAMAFTLPYVDKYVKRKAENTS